MPVQIPSGRKSALDAYGDIIFRAWKDSVGSATQFEVESLCILVGCAKIDAALGLTLKRCACVCIVISREALPIAALALVRRRHKETHLAWKERSLVLKRCACVCIVISRVRHCL